jgi:hypothetical protein
MVERNLTERVGLLEQKIQALDGLPASVAAVEVQILRLREETQGEFSAVRAEMRLLHDDAIARIAAGDEETRTQMRLLHEDAIARITAGDEETRAQMRVLHEDVIARIAALHEGRPRRRK